MATENSQTIRVTKEDDFVLTQKKAAKILGVSEKTVRTWANRLRSKPNAPTLDKRMVQQPNGQAVPRYSKAEVMRLKRKRAEEDTAGTKAERSVGNAGTSTTETRDLTVPPLDISEVPEDQRLLANLVQRIDSERLFLQEKVTALTEEKGALGKELELERKTVLQLKDQLTAPQDDTPSEEPEKQNHTSPNWHRNVVLAALLLLPLAFLVALISPALWGLIQEALRR